ncbi:hypothetical protein SAMN04488564_104133 [Lentzea waywayandensis]|uniref:DUF3137 domain-containing protein n=1 Tax=Lentzea waywayandensis TaxID=84724 RepID=A0A1I6ECV5_9PSEU|nr:hypothetical protein [Lentzea waywayandensis]SFR15352.1 hypothetical protein SAMN04488564_104133 [Lentzea waywayandensis]
MDLLKLWVTDYLLSPLVLTAFAVMIVFMVVRRWLQFRNHAKARDAQIAALTPLAQRLGGNVLGPDEAGMWTAELRKPFENEFSIALRSKRQFDLSLDFQRGQWHVRVTEASVRYDNRGLGVRWMHEHRIEIATARLAPLKVTRPNKYSVNTGQPLSPGQLEAVWKQIVGYEPETAKRDGAEWRPVPLQPPMDQEFSAYGSDPAAAARELNFDALHWLLDHEESLPLWAKGMSLTFESGFVYLLVFRPVQPDELMGVVDVIVGLLDRMPGARPRHPAATV